MALPAGQGAGAGHSAQSLPPSQTGTGEYGAQQPCPPEGHFIVDNTTACLAQRQHPSNPWTLAEGQEIYARAPSKGAAGPGHSLAPMSVELTVTRRHSRIHALNY